MALAPVHKLLLLPCNLFFYIKEYSEIVFVSQNDLLGLSVIAANNNSNDDDNNRTMFSACKQAKNFIFANTFSFFAGKAFAFYFIYILGPSLPLLQRTVDI